MRDLAMQASTGTLSDDDRALVQEEVTALISQIGDVATRTTFNDNVLLNGSVAAGFDIQTGLDTGQVVNITVADLQAAALGVDALDFSTAAGRSEEPTSELQSLMRISYAVF